MATKPATNRNPSQEAARLINTRYGCGPVHFSGTSDALYERHLLFDNGVDLDAATQRDRFEALARSVRDILSQRWLLTEKTYDQENVKRLYYLSMEFLIGRSLENNITNLLLSPLAKEVIREKKLNLLEIVEQEPDAGLGNGGLGRLAACFMESAATMQLPAMGYGLRYEYGIFRQSIRNGWQQETPDNWLRSPDPWEVARPNERVEINLACSFELTGGSLRPVPGRKSTLIGIPFDRPVVGYGGLTINSLRLWAAAASDYFDFEEFSHGDFVEAFTQSLSAETLTRVLYPDDSDFRGQALRLMQEYFLVACSLADAVRRFKQRNIDWRQFPEKVAIQMNDTHPALSVAELMRILVDQEHIGWDEAWRITQNTLAYTNHTLLPEALEKWPVAWFEDLLPRQLEIIYEINRRLLGDVRRRYPAEEQRVRRVSLIEEGAAKKVRMAHLAVIGSHRTNGVAAIHSSLLRETTLKDLAEIYPERFNNKTNGVTPRRWLLLCNPDLSSLISDAIGDGWITDLTQLVRLRALTDDSGFRDQFLKAKRRAKRNFCDWFRWSTGQSLDPETIFDCQIKRIHEYKRQLLNALRITVLYNRLRNSPGLQMHPRTFFFAGKAAPAYRLAKLIIKFINNLAATIESDPAVRGQIKVVFLPEYCVSVAEHLIPASDVSNQISTAGYEASGTSNMKFMMNGALTIGTRDGATIEMAEQAGEENFFLFGLTAEQVLAGRTSYDPHWYYEHEPETREALDSIFSDHFSRNERAVFEPLRNALLRDGDHYMHLADLKSYLEADEKLCALYGEPDEWARKAILNVAGSGEFSSDRTIARYASEIWNLKACPVAGTPEEHPADNVLTIASPARLRASHNV